MALDFRRQLARLPLSAGHGGRENVTGDFYVITESIILQYQGPLSGYQ